jgi:hypothetical protein
VSVRNQGQEKLRGTLQFIAPVRRDVRVPGMVRMGFERPDSSGPMASLVRFRPSRPSAAAYGGARGIAQIAAWRGLAADAPRAMDAGPGRLAL